MMHSPVSGGERYDAAIHAITGLSERDDPSRDVRRRLMTARDMATQVLCGSDWYPEHVVAINRVILQVASEHCFKLTDADRMERALEACRRLARGAAIIDRMETTQ